MGPSTVLWTHRDSFRPLFFFNMSPFTYMKHIPNSKCTQNLGSSLSLNSYHFWSEQMISSCLDYTITLSDLSLCFHHCPTPYRLFQLNCQHDALKICEMQSFLYLNPSTWFPIHSDTGQCLYSHQKSYLLWHMISTQWVFTEYVNKFKEPFILLIFKLMPWFFEGMTSRLLVFPASFMRILVF
jgi:hypothetical protein